jgi:hypothetical protein
MQLSTDNVRQINDWVYEFHRADSISRVRVFQNTWGSLWGIICEDIRLNTPRYSLLFPDERDIIVFSIFSPDCNPHEFAYFQDRLKFVKRRALSLHEIYRFL